MNCAPADQCHNAPTCNTNGQCVYTAKAGIDKDAEHNVLMELSGDPTKDKWEPKGEVFEDKAHITRAAMHLTLVQRAKATLMIERL